VRGGAKAGAARAGGAAGLSASTGFGGSSRRLLAYPQTPSAPGSNVVQINASTKSHRQGKCSAVPSMPVMMMP